MYASQFTTFRIVLQERPSIRYFHPTKFPATMKHRTQTCEQFAKRLDTLLSTITSPDFPKVPTCDCLILDRTIDAVSPVIHEWTYEAMAYDLLPLKNNIYQRPSNTGEPTDILIDENDALWKELRHMHIAEASTAVNDKIDAFKKQNAAARIQARSTALSFLK